MVYFLIVSALDYLNYLILFPSILFWERFQNIEAGYNMMRFLNSAFWASIFYSLLKIVKKIKSNN